MRTTVEIPDDLREKLIAEAARRGEKGYSAVVARALLRYFVVQHSDESRRLAVRRLRGAETGETAIAADADRRTSVRESWRTRRSG